MSAPAEATRILDEIERGTGPDDPREQLAHAIRIADEAGDDDVAYRARMLLTDVAHWVGDADAMLTSFAWCVSKHDSDPARFPITAGGDSPDLLFQHKWIAGVLAGNSRFPAARIDAVLDEMQRRFAEAGLSPNGVHQARRDVALDLGDLDAATRHAAARDLTPRDDYSHCEACQRSTDSGFAALRGDEATAIRLWEEIHAQQLTCGEEPEFADAQILLALLRAGRGDEALAVHARSYRFARTNPDAISMVRLHLEFLAVTGNAERGIELIERHLPGFTVDRISDQHHMQVVRSMAVLLDAAVDAGLGERELRGSEGENVARLFGEGPRRYAIAEFRERAWAAAERLTGALDARNGNGHYAERLAAARALRDERYELPFSSGETYAPIAADADPADAREWLLRAQAHLAGAEWAAARGDAQHGLEAVDAATKDHPADAARVTALLRAALVQAALGADDESAAAEHQQARTAALVAAGDTEYAAAERRIGLLLPGVITRADAARVAEEIDRARTAGTDASLLADMLSSHAALLLEVPGSGDADAELALAEVREAVLVLPDDDPHLLAPALVEVHLTALMQSELFEEAAEVAARAIESRGDGGVPQLVARRVLTVSLASRARFAEAAQAAEGLISDAVRTGSARQIGAAGMLAAQIYGDLGRPREAAARAAFAIRSLESVGESYAGHRHTLASLQLDAGQANEALENFQLALEQLQQAGDAEPEVLARVGSGLGAAATRCGELGIAYRAWSWASQLAEDAELWGVAAGNALDLGDLLREVDDEDALPTAEHALELAHRSGVPVLIARALQLTGWLRCIGGDADGLASLEEAVVIADQAELDERAADARISHARALVLLERPADAVDALRRAAERADAAGLVHFAHLSRMYRADAMVASGAPDEGAAEYRALLPQLDPATEPALVSAAEAAIAALAGGEQ